MNSETFAQVVKFRQSESRRILVDKSKEYARGDRLSNFKKAGLFRGKTPEDTLMGMLVKHLISIDEMISDLTAQPVAQHWARSIWEEKITDAVNYFYLLEGLLHDRYGWEAQEGDLGQASIVE